MDLSIIILNYKSRGLCKTCIRGILGITLNLEYEIIVVDNGSMDGAEVMLKKNFPNAANIKFIEAGENLGHSAGNNIGIRAGTGRNILILNPDIAVMDNAFEKMARYLDVNKYVGAVGCQLKNPDGSTQFSCRRFYKPLTPLLSRTILGSFGWGKAHLEEFLMVNFDHNLTIPVDWIQGSCLMLKREVFDKIGLMDERFFLYFGDVDLCKRVWLSGYEVHHLGTASVMHYFHRESAGGIGALFKFIGRVHLKDGLKFFKKYFFKELL